MKRSLLLILVFVFTYGMSACAKSATPNASTESPSVEDRSSLIAALQAEGATTEIGDPITQDFFHTEGQFVTINGTEGIQVFEYESAETMESDASQVAPDGGSIGTSMVNWIDTPHFYKAGRIIVLYLGSDQSILGLLNKVVGPQFAGR